MFGNGLSISELIAMIMGVVLGIIIGRGGFIDW